MSSLAPCREVKEDISLVLYFTIECRISLEEVEHRGICICACVLSSIVQFVRVTKTEHYCHSVSPDSLFIDDAIRLSAVPVVSLFSGAGDVLLFRCQIIQINLLIYLPETSPIVGKHITYTCFCYWLSVKASCERLKALNSNGDGFPDSETIFLLAYQELEF